MPWSASDIRMEPERLADFGSTWRLSDDKARQPGLVIYENDACKSRRLRITPWLQAISARPWCGDCCISSLTILISMPSISEIDRSQSEKMNQLLFMNKCYHDYHDWADFGPVSWRIPEIPRAFRDLRLAGPIMEIPIFESSAGMLGGLPRCQVDEKLILGCC